MSLIRGLNGSCPCPVCLVPQNQQSNLGIEPLYPLRTINDGASILANQEMTIGEKESALKVLGLRPIAV